MKRAMERHNRGEARVIPIILRPVSWQGAPFGKLQALPTDAKPIALPSWHNLDRAYLDIIVGIRKVVEELITKSEETLSIAYNIFEKLNKRDVDGILDLCISDFQFHNITSKPLSLDELKELMTICFSAFPDSEFTVEDIVTNGEKVVARLRFQGRHFGEFLGIPPTGVRVLIPGIIINRFVNGMIAETWLSIDFLGIMQQIGVIPSGDSYLLVQN